MPDDATECEYAAQAYGSALNNGLGSLGGYSGTNADEMARLLRQSEIQQAIHVLEQANKIRANETLMAKIRDTIRDRRADLATLLDVIG